MRLCGTDPLQQFAVFGWDVDGQYSAIETYRIVPLNRYFPLGQLSGKTLAEQMQIVLSNRLSNLNDEISQDEQDKARLQEYLKGQSP